MRLELPALLVSDLLLACNEGANSSDVALQKAADALLTQGR